MHRFERDSSQGHAESRAGRFTSPQRPGVFEPWLAFVVTALVFAHAVLWGTWNTTLDWVDIAGEGFLLVILLAVYVRTAHSMLATSVRRVLETGLLLLVAAIASDWIEEFFLDAPVLHLLENFGLIAGGPCVLYALFVEERSRGRESSRLQRQAEHFEYLALRDVLTGVGNRHAFDLQLARGVRQNGFALLLLDIDYFKRINDEHGHDVGDDILRLTGELLLSLLRGGDLAYRYGGDEFVLIVDTPDPARAHEIAERLRAGFVRLDHPVLDQGRRDGSYGSLSIGLAMAGPGTEPQSLLKAADQALYRAKQRGRNRIEQA